MRDIPTLPPVSALGASGANRLENASPMDPVGQACMDYRASVANVFRREARGEVVTVCEVCKCEVDVPVPAHDPRCPRKEQVLGADKVGSSGGEQL